MTRFEKRYNAKEKLNLWQNRQAFIFDLWNDKTNLYDPVDTRAGLTASTKSFRNFLLDEKVDLKLEDCSFESRLKSFEINSDDSGNDTFGQLGSLSSIEKEK